jgi:ATP-dependent RNA helicase DeaD
MALEKFQELGLSQEVLDAIARKGFEEPSPIQAAVIPLLLEGKTDVVGQAQTGTGKTAAFSLPLLDKLTPGAGRVQALILCPTRELAVQVSEEIMSLRGSKNFQVAAIYGGQSIDQQTRRLRHGVDIVVGTPGRVIDHIGRGTLDLAAISNFVLDEADEMLDMGFQEDIEEIFKNTNPEKRVLLFSATMPEDILRLAKRYMKDHQVVRVTPAKLTTELTEQIYFEVNEADKFEALCRIIDIEHEFYGLVFCRTKVMSDVIGQKLQERGYDSDVLHGDVTQAQRERILKCFKDKKINILVATDVAARGIDVNNLTHVINYSLPQDPESYVHRIGRTGRAGKSGMAITFVSREESRQLAYIKRISKTDIRRETIPGVDAVIQIKKDRVKTAVEEIVAEGASDVCRSMAGELLAGEAAPQDVLAALISHFFGDELDTKNYKEIRSFAQAGGQGGKSETRLFVARGTIGGFNRDMIANFICDEAHVEPDCILDVHVMEKFSFATVKASEAEIILHAFKKRAKGRPPYVTEAKERQGGGRPQGGYNRGGQGGGYNRGGYDRGGQGGQGYGDRRQGGGYDRPQGSGYGNR